MKNILMIVIDAFRPDHLSMFGYEKETDKNLKKIAQESLVFKNQFSVSNATAPALTSIFSGLLPSTHGVIHQMPYTKPEEFEKVSRIKFWLPSYLKEKGYETMALDWIGDWFEKGFDFYKESEVELDVLFPPTSMTVDLAIKKIKSSKKPFFAFLHLWDTHFPFPNTPNPPVTSDESQKILDSIKDEKQRNYVKMRMNAIKLNSVEDIKNKYDNTIQIIDSEIGRLYEFLKQENILEDTIVIIMGDHGDIVHEHDLYFCHCSLFDGSTKAPLMIRIPGINHKEINQLVQNIDIVPTILELLEDKKELDGKSLLPLIQGDEEIHNEIFLFDGLANDVKSVRTKTLKLIHARDNFCNLCKSSHHNNYEEYDLEKDPGETNNKFSENSQIKIAYPGLQKS